MATRTDTQRIILRELSLTGSDELDPTQVEDQLLRAIQMYSKERPDNDLVTFAGNATHYYKIVTSGTAANLTRWDNEFSELVSLEIFKTSGSDPVVDDGSPSFVDENDFQIYREDADRYIRLPNHQPATSDSVRVKYTAIHQLTDSSDTIPVSDYPALLFLTCHLCCLVLANKYAKRADSKVGSDQVSFRTMSQEWRDNAKVWYTKYREAMGAPQDGSPGAAFATQDVDVSFPWGEDLLLHPASWR